MISILANWLISALSIFLVASYLPGFSVNSFTTALVVALVLGIINAIIKPILIILTLPINILTLGLFTFVINAALIMLAASLVPGFKVAGFGPALVAALILWFISVIVHIVAFPVKAK